MDIKDLAGLSKPLEKFVDVVAKGVGGFSKSYLIRKNADAKAYEIRQLADANKYKMQQQAESLYEAQKLLGNIEIVKGKLVLSSPAEQNVLSLPKRIDDRKLYQEAKEQQNVEEITGIAAEELAHEETVSSESVEDDWIARFFDAAQLISDEQMQVLWGKILAGEIKQPHSYSLRTLELLRNISKIEAELFTKVAKIAIQSNAGAFVINPENGKYLEDNFDITFGHWLRLSELGLISPQDLSRTHKKLDISATVVYLCGDMIVVVEKPADDPEYRFPIKLFTSIGTELVSLVNKEMPETYIHKFASMVKQNNAKVTYGKIIGIAPDGLITHTDLQEFDFGSSDSAK